MSRKETILELLSSHADVLHRMGMAAIGLFGSVVRGEETPTSDGSHAGQVDSSLFWSRLFNGLEHGSGKYSCAGTATKETDLNWREK